MTQLLIISRWENLMLDVNQCTCIYSVFRVGLEIGEGSYLHPIEQYGHKLYEAFRLADKKSLKKIVAINPVGDGIAAAITDRLLIAETKKSNIGTFFDVSSIMNFSLEIILYRLTKIK